MNTSSTILTQTLAIDSDGVLMDFNSKAIELLGNSFVHGDNRIWGELVKHQNFFAELKPMPDAMELWKFANSLKNIKVIVLTAIPRLSSFPLAEQHKKETLLKYFGATDVRIGPFAVDKQNHCKPGDILVDDNARSILQWQLRKGLGIFHVNSKISINCLKELSLS